MKGSDLALVLPEAKRFIDIFLQLSIWYLFCRWA